MKKAGLENNLSCVAGKNLFKHMIFWAAMVLNTALPIILRQIFFR